MLPGHLALAYVTATSYVSVECCGAQVTDSARSFGILLERLTISPEPASPSLNQMGARSGSLLLPTGVRCSQEIAFFWRLAPPSLTSSERSIVLSPASSLTMGWAQTLPLVSETSSSSSHVLLMTVGRRRSSAMRLALPYSYAMLHNDLRALLTALYGKKYASAFSWHSIRIGLACALCAADAPDAVIQLICRWASPDSLKVYRQMGIEKNIFWVSKAHSVTFRRH